MRAVTEIKAEMAENKEVSGGRSTSVGLTGYPGDRT